MKRTALDEFKAQVRQDFERACSTLYTIAARESTQLQRLKLWPEQLRLLGIMRRQEQEGRPVRIVELKGRQSGGSTLAAAWLTHKVLWTPNTRGLLIAHDDVTTNSLFGIARLIYSELPTTLQLPIDKLNRRELKFLPPHHSSLSAQTAGWVKLGHGLTIQHHHWSEIDRWPDPSAVLEGVRETCPMLPGTSIIIESVAESGDGWLRSFWDATKNGGTMYEPAFTPWYTVPLYRLPVPPDMELIEEEKEWVSKYGIDARQIAWYRAKRAEIIAQEPWGGERTMRRLYPFTDDECFQASGLCIFPDAALNRLREGLCPPRLSFRLLVLGNGDVEDIPVPTPTDGDLWVWESPQPGTTYALGVDVSDGVGKTESVVSVCKFPGYEQVAEWASNRTSPEHTAWVTRFLAEKYGGPDALVVPEVNRSGVLTLHILQSLPGSYGIFRWRYLNRPGVPESNNPSLGWETNIRTKAILGQIANMVMLRGQGMIHSEVLYDQMKQCVDLVPGQRWGVEHGKSDRILARMIAMAGAYLEFEGGSIGGIVAEGSPVKAEEPKRIIQPNAMDLDWEDILNGTSIRRGGHLVSWDTLPR